MSEVKGNTLVERDPETNAIIPVMQAYSPAMQGKEVQGNRLVVRDPETNAIVPVVNVIGVEETNPPPGVDEEQVRQIVQEELDGKVIGTVEGAVLNSFGDSPTDTLSQKFLTENTSKWNKGWT